MLTSITAVDKQTRHLYIASVATDAVPTDKPTKAEARVLELAVTPKSNQEIADELSISVRTVDFHLRNLYLKAGVNNRVGLVLNALRGGRA